MYIPKRYGESKTENCPFCGKISTLKNRQGVPVCIAHKNEELGELKCVCGGWLELNSGKWWVYFRCMNCGNVNLKKALEMNPQLKGTAKNGAAGHAKSADYVKSSRSDFSGENNKKNNDDSDDSARRAPREITVTSDQLDFLY